MGSIYVTYRPIPQKTKFEKKPEIRIRDIPEWRSAILFDPDQSDLRMINLTSRLILELCDGRDLDTIKQDYFNLIGDQLGRDESDLQVETGLNDLIENGFVRKQESASI